MKLHPIVADCGKCNKPFITSGNGKCEFCRLLSEIDSYKNCLTSVHELILSGQFVQASKQIEAAIAKYEPVIFEEPNASAYTVGDLLGFPKK